MHEREFWHVVVLGPEPPCTNNFVTGHRGIRALFFSSADKSAFGAKRADRKYGLADEHACLICVLDCAL